MKWGRGESNKKKKRSYSIITSPKVDLHAQKQSRKWGVEGGRSCNTQKNQKFPQEEKERGRGGKHPSPEDRHMGVAGKQKNIRGKELSKSSTIYFASTFILL